MDWPSPPASANTPASSALAFAQRLGPMVAFAPFSYPKPSPSSSYSLKRIALVAAAIDAQLDWGVQLFIAYYTAGPMLRERQPLHEPRPRTRVRHAPLNRNRDNHVDRPDHHRHGQPRHVLLRRGCNARREDQHRRLHQDRQRHREQSRRLIQRRLQLRRQSEHRRLHAVHRRPHRHAGAESPTSRCGPASAARCPRCPSRPTTSRRRTSCDRRRASSPPPPQCQERLVVREWAIRREFGDRLSDGVDRRACGHSIGQGPQSPIHALEAEEFVCW